MPEVPTSFIDNITSFWNNFKPQRDIETAKEKEPKEKEGAGRTVSDIGPRDNPKAPSYLNDTNFSEKINDLKNNSLNNEKSVNTFDRAYQSRLGQISTDFNNNVTNFWNNFKPQRDIETAKEIINYQQVSDYVKKRKYNSRAPIARPKYFLRNNLPKNKEEVNFFDSNDKNKRFSLNDNYQEIDSINENFRITDS